MDGRRTQLFFRAAPGRGPAGTGYGYIVMGGSGWTVTGIIRTDPGFTGLAALAGWGPAEDFKTLSVALARVDGGGVWNLSGRGIGPPPGVLWILHDDRPLLTAAALFAQSWRHRAVSRAFPVPPVAPAAAAPRERISPGSADPFPVSGLAASQDFAVPEKTPGIVPMERPPLSRRQPAAFDPPAPAAGQDKPPESVPLPESASPDTIPELMGKWPEESPFIGLLPGARFVRVPVFGGGSYDHYIVGHIPIGSQGFYLAGVPGSAGWQPPSGLPQFVHYLPARMGGGYWVRYMVPEGT